MTESLYLWSKTAASNASADGAINWAENQAPSSVNNSARSMMAAIAKFRDDIGGAITSTGASNEYTIATNQGIAAHAAGVMVTFKADKTNTGSATTTIDGLAQKTIYRANGSATQAGDITSGGIYTLFRSATSPDGYLLGGLAAPAASDTIAGVIELSTDAEAATGTATDRATTPANIASLAATQAEQEAASSVAKFVSPGRQHFHRGSAKCWAYVTVSAGTPTLQTSFNITSITDTLTGRLTVTIATDFSSANWMSLVSPDLTASDNSRYSGVISKAAGSIILECEASDATLADPAAWNFAGFGDQ